MLIAPICTLVLFFAANDNNVEWGGLSHLEHHDRRPLCPINGQSFDVYFQAYRLDLSSARLRIDAGGNISFVDAVFDHDNGPYAVWRATVPAHASQTLNYWIEVTDGSDTDYLSEAGASDNAPVDGGFKIDYVTYRHAPVGATVCSTGVVFKVWAAASRTQAYVRGAFNNWGTTDEMIRIGDYFVKYVANAQAGQQYKFFFNPGGKWNSDARARRLNPVDNYNTFIIDPLAYSWNDAAFQVPAFEDMVVYELHVGTFAGRNDPAASGSVPATYRDVAAHAAHFVELGVNVVEVTPINEFPTDFSAGYNPITQYAPEWRYGTPDDLRYMVDVLHQHGIAVVVDIVWNHFSPTDNYMWMYDGTQLYFDNPAVNTPWGSQADFDSAQVRDYFLDSVPYWIEEFHVDGFRMDATDFMNISPQEAAGWSLMQDFNNLMDRRYVHKIAFAEQLPDDPWVTRPVGLGGAGFDSQWHDYFVDTLRQEIFDAAFGDPEMWKIGSLVNGGGQYLENLAVLHYFELHDECWASSGGQRAVRTIDTTSPYNDIYAMGRTKLAQGVVFTSPGIPAIVQGTEWLEDTNFGSGNAGGADRIDWSKKTTYRGIFDYYSHLSAIRHTNGALQGNAPRQVQHLNESGNVLGFQRFDLNGNVLMVVVNFSNSDYTSYQIGLPQPGTWYELLNSQNPAYDGDGPINCGPIAADAGPYDGQPQSARINVAGMGLIILRWNDPPDAFLDADQDAILNSCDNCPDVANPDQADGDQDGIGDACETSFAPGDMNCDGAVTVSDIGGFVLALTDPAGYASQFPNCSLDNADINNDSAVTVSDIGPFVALLTGG